MAYQYTKDGIEIVHVGGTVKYNGRTYKKVTEGWLINRGFYPYKVVAEDGTDGVVDGWWIHYIGAPEIVEEQEDNNPS